MAENVKALRRRLRSIRSTRQITRAMEMVSASKLRRAQEVLMAGRPYAHKLQELLGHVARSTQVEHPLLERREVRRRLLVVITADRGLAGAFNAQVLKRAEAYLRETTEETSVVCIGKKAFDFFKTRRWPIIFSITDHGARVSTERAREIADRLTEEFLSSRTDEVLLLYNAYVSTLVFRPTLAQLLPLNSETLLEEAPEPNGFRPDYIFSPSREEVFSKLLPRYVLSKVYICLAESFTAEHSARMVAMTGATRNCDDLIVALTLSMNKARQTAITTEILEIVGGAEALKG